jgi:hypothetical protein
LYRIAAFGDRLSCLIDPAIQALFGFGDIRTISQQISCRLKEEQNSLKTLQQCVMQFAGYARAL